MKKILCIATLFILLFCVSCEALEEWLDKIGNRTDTYEKNLQGYNAVVKGEAGGFIIYDCDADNETGNADGLKSSECGWRYIEAAPEDIFTVVSGINQYNLPYAFYRYLNPVNGEITFLYTNGTSTYKEEDCTTKYLGAGKSNTEKLVAAMGADGKGAYMTSAADSGTTANYAANICANYSLTNSDTQQVYDDWFLPSYYELKVMQKSVVLQNNQSFYNTSYWSSSELYNSQPGHKTDSALFAMNLHFRTGMPESDTARNNTYRVRPVRYCSIAFTPSVE